MEDAAAGERNSFATVKLPPSAAAAAGPRPHRCEICQRSFREIATLRKHEQLHRADRPYVCQTCGKSFLWSSNLKVHERVHTGERPYKCKICHRCFTQSNDLRRHERNVHMRGKIYGYKNAHLGMGRGVPATGGGSHMNLAAYQAFAMQQRALLQQALSYENYLHHSAAVTQSQMFSQPQTVPILQSKSEGMSMIQAKSDEVPPLCLPGSSTNNMAAANVHEHREIQCSPIKLEQVTPPSTPGESEGVHAEKRNALPATSSHNTDNLHSPISSRFQSMSHAGHAVPMHSPMHSPPMLVAVGPHYSRKQGPTPPHRSPHQLSPQNHHAPLPSFSSFRQMPCSSADYESEPDRLSASSINAVACHQREGERRIEHEEREKYQSCDSVMDLSMNKTSDSSEKADPGRVVHTMPPPKTPSSESECEGKRDVTTTSATPLADSGIHHCQHCNIFFYDYTMFHLHESLHMPYSEYPFRCPSCGKHCQDRIEFMFHTVWHVKYPHTIPNYQPFKETFIT